MREDLRMRISDPVGPKNIHVKYNIDAHVRRIAHALSNLANQEVTNHPPLGLA